jgi:CheY-like chemotaxis protein
MANKRILYVEDEQHIREPVTWILEDEGYEVVACADGTEALAAYATATAPFDIVMTDLEMPVMGGVALAREIRKANSVIPIIVRSARPLEYIQERTPNLEALNIVYNGKNTGDTYLDLIKSQLHRRDRGDAAPAV